MSGNNKPDNIADKSTQQIKDTGEKAGKSAGRMAGKALFSAGKKALVFVITQLIALFTAFLPIILGLVLVISIMFVMFYFGSETRGTDQEYDMDTSQEFNVYQDEKNEHGDPIIDSLTEENSFLQIFYENEVKDSYWKFYEKDGKTILDYGANEKPMHDEVVDKYNKEQFFQLNAMQLYALDEYLNLNSASTPQTFIKHVPFDVDDDGRLKSVPLTDEENKLVIQSHAFEKTDDIGDDSRGIYRKKYDSNNEPVLTEGVWDYGFAPVYNYKEFEEKVEMRNEITGGETWDKDAQQMVKMTTGELSSFVGGDGSSVVPDVEGKESRTSYLIQDALTPLGVIRNEIEQIWQESGHVEKRTVERTINVPVKKTRKVPITPENIDSEVDTSDNDGTDDEEVIDYRTESYYENEPRTQKIEVTGTEWEEVPRYVGQPDTSDLESLDYFKDYFEYYDNYVEVKSFKDGPLTYLAEAREEEHKGINTKDATTGKYVYGRPPSLEERREGGKPIDLDGNEAKEHPLMKEVRELQLEHFDSSLAGLSGAIDLAGVDFASESDSKAVENASRYLPLFKEYGEMYGIDPMLLVALAAVETEGNHEQTAGHKGYKGVRRSYLYSGNGYSDKAAIGLMQLLPTVGNPTKAKSVTAFNQLTGENETFTATQEDLHELENNIKYGAMQLASEMNAANHDVLTGIMAYHTGISFALYITDENTPYDTWSPEAVQGYYEHMGRKLGTSNFVERVLARYLPTAESQFPWVINKEGEKITPEVHNLETPSGTPINIDVSANVGGKTTRSKGKFQSATDTLSKFVTAPFRALASAAGWLADGLKSIGEFLNIYDGTDKSDYYRVGDTVSGDDVNQLIYTTLAYEEGLHLSHYRDLSEEELIKVMIESFMNSVREESSIGMNIDPSEYFPDGYQSPVKNINILRHFGHLSRGNRSEHIHLAVPGNTKIYAVADGTIDSMDENSIVIDHGGGVKTHYESVASIAVSDKSVGDEVKKGEWIASGSNGDDATVAEGGFKFGLSKGGFTNPLWVVDPEALHSKPAGGEILIHPSETNFRHPYTGRAYRKTSDFNPKRIHPNTGKVTPHKGTDYAGTGSNRAVNQPIGAVDNAVVNHSGWINGFGNTVVLEHPHLQRPDGRKVFTLYAHMVRTPPVSKGQVISQGQTIGNEGNTGNSKGDHLHIELIVGHGDNWYQAKGRGLGNVMDIDIHFRH